VLSLLEGVLMVTMSLWLVDLFQRRFNHQGALGREMSRAAYGAFVLVGLVLAARLAPWPPELKYLTVSALGVAASYGFAAHLVRLPGVSRVV
jgi:glucans biosynthesis protein C